MPPWLTCSLIRMKSPSWSLLISFSSAKNVLWCGWQFCLSWRPGVSEELCFLVLVISSSNKHLCLGARGRRTCSKLKGARTPSDWVNQTDQLVPSSGLNSPQFLTPGYQLMVLHFPGPETVILKLCLPLSPQFLLIKLLSKVQPLWSVNFKGSSPPGSFWHPKS